MSIHTHQVKLSNMNIHYEALFNKLAPALDDAQNVFALHCNHGHAVKLSWQHDESLWKKIPTELELSQKNRKVSGDGSCFQACVEVYIRIKHPEIDPLKIYKIRSSRPPAPSRRPAAASAPTGRDHRGQPPHRFPQRERRGSRRTATLLRWVARAGHGDEELPLAAGARRPAAGPLQLPTQLVHKRIEGGQARRARGSIHKAPVHHHQHGQSRRRLQDLVLLSRQGRH